MATRRSTLMVLAILARARAGGLSGKASAKEVRQDSEQGASTHVDAMTSSMYLSVERKTAAPHRAPGPSSQAGSLKGVLACGAIPAAVAHFVVAPLVRELLPQWPMLGALEGCAEAAASESPRAEGTPPEQPHQCEEATLRSSKRTLAGGLAALSVLAALGAGKARRRWAKSRRSYPARRRSSTSRSASVDSDLSTALATTPRRSSDGSRSAGSDDEACEELRFGLDGLARRSGQPSATPQTQFFRIGTEG